MPPAKFLSVQNSTWGIISQPPFIISDLLLIILTAVTVLQDRDTSSCVLHWICSSYILVFLNSYLGARFCPVVSLIFKCFCPVDGHAFFSPFCMLWFPFPLQSQTETAGKTLILEDKSEIVVRNCGFQPPSSFPFFRKQNLAHSDTGATSPPRALWSPGSSWALPCPSIIQAWVPHLHFPIVAPWLHQARAAFPVRSPGDAAGAMDVQGKAWMISPVKWTLGCCYPHAVFPSNFTGSHVCTKLSLKMLKTELWGAHWKVSLEPFRQFRLYHPIFSLFLPSYHSAAMNLIDTSSEGNGKYLSVCQLQKKKKKD